MDTDWIIGTCWTISGGTAIRAIANGTSFNSNKFRYRW